MSTPAPTDAHDDDDALAAASLALAAAPPDPGRPVAWATAAVALGASALVAARTFQLLYTAPLRAAPTLVAWGVTVALAVAAAWRVAARARGVRGAALALLALGAGVGLLHVVLCEGATAADAREWFARVGSLLRAPRVVVRDAGPWGLALGALLAPPAAGAVLAREARSADATNALRLLAGAWLLLEGWLVAGYLLRTSLWPLPVAAVAAGVLYAALALRADARARDPATIAREPLLAATFRARRRVVAAIVLALGLTAGPYLAAARAPRHPPAAVRRAYPGAALAPYTAFAVPGVALWRATRERDGTAAVVGTDARGGLVRGAALFARAGRPADPAAHARIAAATLFDDAETTVMLPRARTPDMDAARVTPPRVQGDTLSFWIERHLRAADGTRYSAAWHVWVDANTGAILRMLDAGGQGYSRQRGAHPPVRGFDDAPSVDGDRRP